MINAYKNKKKTVYYKQIIAIKEFLLLKLKKYERDTT